MNHKVFGYAVQADIPIHLSGWAGIGKTRYVEAFAEAIGMKMHTEVLSQADPTDFGWPREENGVIKRMPIDWLKRASEIPYIVFFDELTLAPRACVAAALRLISERNIGGLPLHPDTRFIAASNPVELTGTELLPQMANRFMHISFEKDLMPLSDWIQGMLSGFTPPDYAMLPERWTEFIPKHRALIASFVSRNATEAFRTASDAATLGRAWPSRRTWDMGAKICAACEAGGEDDSLALAAVVGDGPAMAFVSWRAQQDSPDPAAVLADPANHKLPAEDDKLFVTLSSVAAYAIAKPAPKLWAAAWVVCKRAVDMKKADIAIVAARVLASNMPTGATLPKDAAALLPMLKLAAGGKR